MNRLSGGGCKKTYNMLLNTVENDGLTELCDVELCELTKIVCFMTRFGRVETFLMKWFD